MTDSGGEAQWYFSQVKGTTEDEVNEADIISTVEFNEDGELLATGDKGGRIVIFQREQLSKSQLQNSYNSSSLSTNINNNNNNSNINIFNNNNNHALMRTEYNVYSTFQSHEAEFDYLKSLEIEEKINKIKWLKRKNVAHFLLSTNDKTVKLWKIRERNKRAVLASTESSSSSILSANGTLQLNGNVSVRDDINGYIRSVSIPVVKYMDRIEVEAIPKRVFANAHTYHINSISLNSDQETFMSADDLRINLWHIEITNQSFNIVDIKPANMEELTEVITAAEFHPKECNLFVYSSSKGMIRLCDMRQSALCDTQAKIFEEREDPTTKNFFSEIISSISDVKFSHSGRYLCTRDYLHVKIWDLNMENRPVETYCVHDYLRNKLCVLYENDCIFDKFECSWSSNDDHILSGSYNNFFKSFNRNTKQELMFECSREQTKPRQPLRPKRVVNSNMTNGGTTANTATTTAGSNGAANCSKRNILNGKSSYYKDEVNVDSLDFTKKILHSSWHPRDNIVAIAATNNLYLFYNKDTTINPGSAFNCSSSASMLSSSAQMNCSSSSSSSSSSTSSSFSTNTVTSTNCFNSLQNNSNNNTLNLTQSQPPPPPSSLSSPATNGIVNGVAGGGGGSNGLNGPDTSSTTNLNNQIQLNTSFYTASPSNSQTSPSSAISQSTPLNPTNGSQPATTSMSL